MRIAIYDGILEKHVVDSLIRAFRLRGHEVYDTGKIGHGFEFPTGENHLQKLSSHVDKVIQFKPDWVFVFRPASLPIHLLKRIKNHSINVAAWFSDDPVLFGLTYGSVVQFYDLILHCGGSEVLSFYEKEFGRPTGVNFPFWTDHEAFPAVWGKEKASNEVMFLGNVQDEVRRKRYFDLSKIDASLRLYGNAGNDYYGISGGFLDTNEEVVAAGSRSKMAVNIPQFFVDHRGLRTWFPGLDTLGFFEYPSRVIQYMAMGLPTLSIIPNVAELSTFPEMIIADDFSDASHKIREIIDGDSLAKISESTLNRFDRNFSALARVLMFEHLVEDDSWRTASVEERAAWFTQYDATRTNNSLEINASTRKSETIELNSSNSEFTDLKIIILSEDRTGAGSRSNTTARALKNLGIQVQHVSGPDCAKFLAPDPQKIHKFAVVVNKLHNQFGNFDGLILADLDAVLTNSASTYLKEKGVWSLHIDDSGISTSSRMSRLTQNFDLVAVSSPHTFGLLKEINNSLVFLPPYVDEGFIQALAETSSCQSGIRIRSTSQIEEAMAPGFAQDLAIEPTSWEELEDLDLPRLAAALKTPLSFASFSQTRANPKLSTLFAYVLAASEYTFIPRLPVVDYSALMANVAIQVRGAGEVSAKVSDLASSKLQQENFKAGKKRALETTFNAEYRIAKLIDQIRFGSKEDLLIDPPTERPQDLIFDFDAMTPELGTSCLLSIQSTQGVIWPGVSVTITDGKKNYVRESLDRNGKNWRILTNSRAAMKTLSLQINLPSHARDSLEVKFSPEKTLTIGQTDRIAILDA